VVLSGNLAEMGAWGDGVRMAPHPRDPLVWSATLDLPFTFFDNCFDGLFQFRYKVVTAGGAELSEGAPVRTENKLQAHFFHVFRPNYAEPRLKALPVVNGKASFRALAALLAEDLRLRTPGDAGNLSGCLGRFQCLVNSATGAARSDAEEVFDDVLASSEFRDAALILPSSCLPACIFHRASKPPSSCLLPTHTHGFLALTWP
jgi:hypothetical protein